MNSERYFSKWQKHDNGPAVKIQLERTPSVAVLDRRRMFELFTALKTMGKVQQQGSASTASLASLVKQQHTANASKDLQKSESQVVDEIISLWTKIVIEDAEEMKKFQENVVNMQNDGFRQLDMLKAVLEQIFSVFLVDMQNMSKISNQNPGLEAAVMDLEAQLKALRAKLAEEADRSRQLEDENSRLKVLLAGANLDNEHLRGRVKEFEGLNKDKNDRIRRYAF